MFLIRLPDCPFVSQFFVTHCPTVVIIGERIEMKTSLLIAGMSAVLVQGTLYGPSDLEEICVEDGFWPLRLLAF
jgi:hypothetical protein